MTHVYFLKNKSEAFQRFREYKAKVENLLNKKIKILRSDDGLEFCNKEFDNYLKQMGIIHQETNPYTPQRNGLSERFNRTLVGKAKCLLFDAGLEKKFWAEAVSTAVYLKNRSISTGLNNKTPFEMWTGKKPDIRHLRIFGSTVMVHVPKEKRTKWDMKSECCILMGYAEDVKGYRVYIPKTQTITTSRDVIIIEKDNSTSPQTVIEIEQKENLSTDIAKCLDSVGDNDDCKSDDSYVTTINVDSNDETYLPTVTEDSDSSTESVPSEMQVKQKQARQRRVPERFGYLNICTRINKLDVNVITLKEALQGPEKECWLQAVKDELQCFEDNQARELVDAPTSGTVVKCKWVLKKKCDSENGVRYRARLVAKGYSKKSGVDYDETFSPVVRHSTLRLLCALSVQLNLDVTHLDVKTAFLNGDLNETIYMEKPDGFVCSSADNNKILKLKKAIYGLKQSSRAWHKKVDNRLSEIGYTKSKLEPCLYTKIVDGYKTIVTLYVDDFFIFSNDETETLRLKEILSSKFKIKDLGQIKQCLGMSVHIDKQNNIITLSQENYIDQLLLKFNTSECKTVNTSMETKLNIDKCSDSNSSKPYQQLLGSLMYLSVLTRPDIAYSVGYLSQFNNCHSDEHWSYAKRILRYLKKN